MKKRKNIITVAIDSPAAAGAGTQAKLISNNYIPNFPTQMNLNLPKMDKISLPQKPKNL